MTKAANVEHERAVSIVVYNLQGGSLPERAIEQLEQAVETIAQTYDGLAITVARG